MLQGDDAPFFSLLLIFYLYWVSLTSEIVYISSTNHYYPFLSLMLLFCTMFFVYFIQLTSTLSHQHTQMVTVQITVAFIGTNRNPTELVSAGLGFSEGSCGRLQTNWDMSGGSARFATRWGWRTESVCGNLLTLWRSHDFLLNLKIPSVRRIIISKLPGQPFIIYLNTAWSVAFFWQW